MEIEFGNAATLDTNGTGWFVGFSDWAKEKLSGGPNLRYLPKETGAREICLKWLFHPKGDPRGAVKPPSFGRTLSILVSETGCFRLQFSRQPDFPAADRVEYTLEKHGQFVVWGEHLYHRWLVDSDCTILTLRWTPESAPVP